MLKFTMYAGGTLFGFGLAIAGATRPEVVLSFLNLRDLGLALVIGGALLVTLVTFQGVPKLLKKPLFGSAFDGHDGFLVTKNTVVGALLFGLGWGISGICPATSLASVGTGNWPLFFAVAGMLLGSLLYGTLKSRSGGH